MKRFNSLTVFNMQNAVIVVRDVCVGYVYIAKQLKVVQMCARTHLV